MNGSGKAEMRQVSLAALPSINITSFSGSSTRGGPFSRSSFRDLPAGRVRAQSSHDTVPTPPQPCRPHTLPCLPPRPTRPLNMGVGK
uniref:Uncharacterized protein n=1 Tax=Rhinolophus ferrumequinum TaxID=59479 RepID=A0A671E7V8_RHIFE